MSIELITLDLDNTLWDVERIIVRAEKKLQAWIKQNSAEAHELYRPEVLAELREDVLQAHADQRHDFTFLRKAVLERLMLKAGHPGAEARDLATSAFDVFFIARNDVELFPGAQAMLTELSQRFMIYSLTNGNADVTKAGIHTYLSGAISSADVGRSKPDPAMFEAALAHAGVPAARTLHVGDHLVDDVQGANDAGLHTLWINLDEQPLAEDASTPDLVATSLTQVVSLIDAYRSSI